MSSFVVSFFISVIATLFLIRMAKHHGAALDLDLDGVQKVHAHAVPRIGGVAIFVGVVVASGVTIWREHELGMSIITLLGCSFVAFFGGIVEDFTGSVSPARRFLLTLVAAGLGYYFLHARIERFDLAGMSWLFPYVWLTLPLTLIAVAGIANAINIIDGFNGLSSVVSICMLLSLGYVAFQVNDMFVLVTAFMVAGGTAGFFVWNYPAGLIFLGDGGAYFLGFMLGELSILLVMRNPAVSTWYAALLLIYPVFETVFSVYRRFFVRGTSPSMPDGIHLHSLIFRRVVVWAVGRHEARALTRRNAMTSPYLWLLSLMAVIPATVFWHRSLVLMALCVVFIASYVWLYASIVRFRSPRWLLPRRRK